MFLQSLINIFVAPVAVRAARVLSKKHGSQDFFHQGIAIYCPEAHKPLIKESLEEVVRFFGDDWRRYRKNVKCIIVDPEVGSTLWFSKRTLLIRETDPNRMSSTVHMAGWLIADFQRIYELKRRFALHCIWNRGVIDTANESGKRLRDQYVALRQNG